MSDDAKCRARGYHESNGMIIDTFPPIITCDCGYQWDGNDDGTYRVTVPAQETQTISAEVGELPSDLLND